MSDFDDAIVKEFVAEAHELLDAADAELIAIGDGDPTNDRVDAAFRALHTIKGNAGFLSQDAIVELAHQSESRLSPYRDDAASIDRSLVESLLASTSEIRQLVSGLERGDAHRPRTSPLTTMALDEETNHDGATELPEHRHALLNAFEHDLKQGLDAMRNACAEGAGGEPLTHIQAQCDGLIRAAAYFQRPTLAEALQAIRTLVTDADVGTDEESTIHERLFELIDAAEGAFRTSGAESEVASDVSMSARPQATSQNDVERAPLTTPFVRVDAGRLEAVLDLVSELSLRKNQFAALQESHSQSNGQSNASARDVQEQVRRLAEDLDRLTSDLQHATLHVRMQSMRTLFNRYPKFIQDTARSAGKRVELTLEGGDLEMDRSVLEALGEALTHLLRNSVDHGIETTEERVAAGKPGIGRITVCATQDGDEAVVRVIDDGRGLNHHRLREVAAEQGIAAPAEAHSWSEADLDQLIFRPGVSTSTSASMLSGRGVGMDAVKERIQRLGGSVSVESREGHGVTVTIKAPLSIALTRALLIRVGEDVLAIPVSRVVAARRLSDASKPTTSRTIVLREILDAPSSGATDAFEIDVEKDGERATLVVSEVLERDEFVARPLHRVWAGEAPFSAAAIGPAGQVILIIDVGRLYRLDALRRPAKPADELKEAMP